MGWIESIPDHYSKGLMIGLAIGFMVLPVVAVPLRFWAKRLSGSAITLDDYLIVAAAAVAVGCCTTQLVGSIDGLMGQHQPLGPDGQPDLNDPKFITYEKAKFAANMLSCIGLGFVKASVVAFYMTIFRGPVFTWVARSLMAVIFTWTVSFFFANLFTCYPVTPFVESVYGHRCIDTLAMWYGMAISDVIVDFIILLVPIPNVLMLQLRPKMKLGVIGVFLTGSSVLGFSITRTIMYYHVGTTYAEHGNDETYYTSPVFFWAVIELSTAVFCACLPLYRPVWNYLRHGRVQQSGSRLDKGTKGSRLSRPHSARYDFDLDSDDSTT